MSDEARPDCGYNEKEIVRLERLLLRALCQGTPRGSVLEAGRHLLASYSWHEPVHQVIFEVLTALPSDKPWQVRDQLPARLTRRGFPDVDWEYLFQPHSLSMDEVEKLIRRILELNGSEETR